jgi:hypothetical protein
VPFKARLAGTDRAQAAYERLHDVVVQLSRTHPAAGKKEILSWASQMSIQLGRVPAFLDASGVDADPFGRSSHEE